MAWPHWAGPFGFPETEDELRNAMLTSLLLVLTGTAFYALEVYRTIPRMAAHHYSNPSRRAILGQAAKQTSFPSVSRALGIFVRANPLVIPLSIGMAYRDLVSDDLDPHRHAAIHRARSAAMGGTGTHLILQEPYIENPEGDRMYYSFHPEWI